ncbi:MAG TPA: isoprenylcysteine carboxylmethyltransferase family protein [Candidatus Baltobacteraceae bacterium]|nr:isoprenylcysteine carboxylmethyltransferase family protein [Candidatus Baltobacteraceae bacterium]
MSTQPAPHRAPWYYRWRFSLIGALYGAAFFFGYLVLGLIGQQPVLLYKQSGYPLIVGLLSALCAVGGYALRVWASSYLAASIVWKPDVALGELRVSGPYRSTRNPLYLGNVLQAIGVGLVSPWTVLVLLLMGMPAYMLALIGVEEKFLASELGESYARYRQSVARLLPLPGKIAAPGEQPGSLRDGVRSEVMTGIIAFGVLAGLIYTWPR